MLGTAVLDLRDAQYPSMKVYGDDGKYHRYQLEVVNGHLVLARGDFQGGEPGVQPRCFDTLMDDRPRKPLETAVPIELQQTVAAAQKATKLLNDQ
eukprot:9657480-Alexandrium_andersonii.AAC.1